MRVIIMAQGRQERLTSLPYPKHFLVADVRTGESIVERTIRMVKEGAPQADVVVVAHATDGWQALCAKRGVQLVSFAVPGDDLLTGLHQTRVFWASPTVVLLGDVVFASATLRAALALDRPALVGRAGLAGLKGYGELFALTRPEEIPSRTIPTTGRLWSLQGQLDLVQVPDDWSDDIDTPYDLTNVLPALQYLITTTELQFCRSTRGA